MTFKEYRRKLKDDKGLLVVCVLFVLLAFFHYDYSHYTEHTQCFIRCGFCLFIALSTALFYRIGFSVSFLAYAYTLIYFNTFFNFTSFVYVLIAIRCTPKLKIPALVLYVIDIIVLFGQRQLVISALAIHITCCIIISILLYIFFGIFKQESEPVKSDSDSLLKLNDDERNILSELAKGKLQKQVNGYSENTVTKHLKNAMERNNCKSKTELMHKYFKENPPETESQSIVIESQEQSQKQDA